MAEFMLGGQKSVIDNSPGAQTFHAENHGLKQRC